MRLKTIGNNKSYELPWTYRRLCYFDWISDFDRIKVPSIQPSQLRLSDFITYSVCRKSQTQIWGDRLTPCFTFGLINGVIKNMPLSFPKSTTHVHFLLLHEIKKSGTRKKTCFRKSQIRGFERLKSSRILDCTYMTLFFWLRDT